MRKSQSHRVKTSQKENGKHFRSFFLASILLRLDLISLYHRPVTVCFWCVPGSHLRVRLCVSMTKSLREIAFPVFPNNFVMERTRSAIGIVIFFLEDLFSKQKTE